MYKIKDFQPRLYQETITSTAIRSNTLICLPTGRGKTKTAILIALHRLNNFPQSKVVFLTPTKPLAAQIAEEFKKNTTIGNVVLFTGNVKPEERARLFTDATLIVSTPQGFSNDIISKRVDLRDVSLVVFDECQHATGDYDYVWIAKQYQKIGNYPRIIGLSASPGSNLEKISEICDNLFIEDIEVRTDQDEDLKPYVQETTVHYDVVSLSEDFKVAKKFLDTCVKTKLQLLKDAGLSKSVKYTSKTQLLGMQRDLQRRIATGERDPMIWKLVVLVAEMMKVYHAQELFETQGIESAHTYMKKIYKEAEAGKVKSAKSLALDMHFKGAYHKISEMVEDGVKHPKLERLISLLEKEIEHSNKILIFSHYRDSAKKLKEELEKIQRVKAGLFVGQAKKKGTGLSQKEQIQLLEDFKEGKFNVLIGTSVGEEGIDIPSVGLIIFYEPVPSAIRTVQRRGRTGRLEDGRVIVLVTKDTRDEAYRWTAYHKENRMHRVLKQLKSKLSLHKPKEVPLTAYVKKLKVYADTREKGSGIMKYLVDENVDVMVQQLDVGDFLVSDRVGVERKEVRDFVDSLIDKRLLQQVKNLKEHFERPLLIIEGVEDLYSVRKVHPNAIRGMLAWIAVDMKVPIVYTKSAKDTADFLITLAKREQETSEKDFGVRGERKPLTTKELQEYIVSGLPGVGPSLAKRLLAEFASIKEIVNANEEELTRIDKLGKKKAQEIKRILEEKYEKD